MVIEKINAALNAEQVLQLLQYKLDRVEQNGTSLRAFCPIHKDPFLRTLRVDPGQKRFRCSYSKCPGAKGGTFFELFVLAKECTELEAIEELTSGLGLQVNLATLETEAEQKATEPQGANLDDLLSEEEESVEILQKVPSDVDSDDELNALVEDAVLGIEEDFSASEAELEQKGTQAEEEVALESRKAKGPSEKSKNQPEEVKTSAKDAKPPKTPKRPAKAGGKTKSSSAKADQQEQNWEKLYNAGLYLFEENRYTQAEEKLVEALEKTQDSESEGQVALTLAKCYLQRKRIDEVNSMIEGILKKQEVSSPLDKQLRRLLATGYEKKGNLARAGEVLKSIVTKHGEDSETVNRIKRLSTKKGENESISSKKRISYL